MNRHLAKEALDEIYLAERRSAATDLFFVRQAEGEHETGAAQTEDDAALTERDRAQAALVARHLQRIPLSAVFCADTRPAFETAALIAAASALTFEALGHLRDVDFVDDPRPTPALSLSEAIRAFSCLPRWDMFPGSEGSRSYRHRVIQTLEAIVARHRGENVAVICSGSTINAYLGMVLAIPRDVFFLAGPGTISTLRIDDGRYSVLSLNNSLHLAEISAA
jgi:broad specificity phosphatase PhoE